jgi:hypothetical protein
MDRNGDFSRNHFKNKQVANNLIVNDLLIMFRSGGDQYLEHLLALMEVLEPILQNDDKSIENPNSNSEVP